MPHLHTITGNELGLLQVSTVYSGDIFALLPWWDLALFKQHTQMVHTKECKVDTSYLNIINMYL